MAGWLGTAAVRKDFVHGQFTSCSAFAIRPMKPRTIAIVVLIVGFAIGLSYALLREVEREEVRLASSLSGVVEVDPQLFGRGVADIVRTDRLALYLLDPATRRPVALTFLNPLVPPQVFQVGQENSSGDVPLKGSFLLVGITDKDGEIFKVTPGEVYGRSPQPIALGTEEVRLVLNEPFRGSLFNEAGPATAPSATKPSAGAPAAMSDPRLIIAGTVRVVEGLRAGLEPSDRMIVLLMDPQTGRPAATKIIPHLLLPQAFSIAAPPGSAGKSYYLRIITDKDGQPVNSVPGEVVGRSTSPIPVGTKDIDFVLDSPYQR